MLKLAPHNCNQTIFAIYKTGGKNSPIQLKIYGENVNLDEAPKILGINFDKFLNFKNQISKTKSKVSDIINLLKILSFDTIDQSGFSGYGRQDRRHQATH